MIYDAYLVCLVLNLYKAIDCPVNHEAGSPSNRRLSRLNCLAAGEEQKIGKMSLSRRDDATREHYFAENHVRIFV